jgi:DNA-directed RNA polymerase I subunit RPA2
MILEPWDMPQTKDGIVPDIIINPHAFPSRMTIGQLVESMAGKAGALHGAFQSATPFRFGEGHAGGGASAGRPRVGDHFGQQLVGAGYAYYGTEAMTSGVTGEPLGVDIFYGVVYYQRLRHMVKDKAQVRSTGPTNALTRQPVKGRKKGGGIRFGEMERDCLISHGTACHHSSKGSNLSNFVLPIFFSCIRNYFVSTIIGVVHINIRSRWTIRIKKSFER